MAPNTANDGLPSASETTRMSCQRMPVESPTALISASFAANRPARDRSGRARPAPLVVSSAVNSRSSSAGVRVAARSNLARSTRSTPMPTITALVQPRHFQPHPTTALSQPRNHSTVTDLARLRGWSTSRPLAAASSIAKICSGTTDSSGPNRVEATGTANTTSAYGSTAASPFSAMARIRAPRARISWMFEIDLRMQRAVLARARHDHEDRLPGLDQRDRAVLELAGGEALRRGCRRAP